MKVLVQWTLRAPRDYVSVDSSRWASLPRKPKPAGAVLDNAPGWVHGLNVLGVDFTGFDAYAVEPVSGGVRATAWTAGDIAYEWTLTERLVTRSFPGGRFDGPDQSLRIFASPAYLATLPKGLMCAGRTVDQLDFGQFAAPANPIYGVQTSDELHEAHMAARRPVGLSEWGC